MNRAEHLQWAKDHAMKCVARGDLADAVASMVSDLNKHDELRCAPILAVIGILSAHANDRHGVERFIQGFN